MLHLGVGPVGERLALDLSQGEEHKGELRSSSAEREKREQRVCVCVRERARKKREKECTVYVCVHACVCVCVCVGERANRESARGMASTFRTSIHAPSALLRMWADCEPLAAASAISLVIAIALEEEREREGEHGREEREGVAGKLRLTNAY